MKVIVAGSRNIRDIRIVSNAIKNSGFDVTEIISGGAYGVDQLGEKYAQANNIKLTIVRAEWDNLEATPCSIAISDKTGRPYNRLAGFNRNEKMADMADALIVVHNNTPGSLHMKSIAKLKGLPIFEVCVI